MPRLALTPASRWLRPLAVVAAIYAPHALLLWGEFTGVAEFLAGWAWLNQARLVAVAPGGAVAVWIERLELFWDYDVLYCAMALAALGWIAAACLAERRRPRWMSLGMLLFCLSSASLVHVWWMRDYSDRIEPFVVWAFTREGCRAVYEPTLLFPGKGPVNVPGLRSIQ